MGLRCQTRANLCVESQQNSKTRKRLACLLSVLSVYVLLSESAVADSVDATIPETLSLHGQFTHLWQYHQAFRSLYRGTNSLDPGSLGDETTDATLYPRLHVWRDGEIEIGPEVDQGFGLSNTMGLAAFPSGEAYKLGKTSPYLRLQRLLVRQTIDLGGNDVAYDPAPQQFGGQQANDTLVLTAGKFSIVDIFDTNPYAHGPRGDFMNRAIIDAGAFDYAGDAWGYSYGLAAEWTHNRWTLRGGIFNLSRVPGSTELQRNFGQFEITGEIERLYTLGSEKGSLKLLGFLNRGRMGAYRDAVRLAKATHASPNTALVRTYASRAGGAVNLEQAISHNIGIFARVSVNNGSKETFDFTDINASVAAGLSWKGASWDRPCDTVGIALEASEISKSARTYFAAGGLGILIGDGKLAHYGSEDVIETYYDAAVVAGIYLTADYQWIANPAYNRDRGPVSVLSVRFHAEL